jgi:hypothetical protein
MLLKRFIALWAASTLVVGKTPGGFIPTSNTDLIVIYGQTAAMNGVVVDEEGNAAFSSVSILLGY